MNYYLSILSGILLLSSCVNKTDIQNEIATYHACVTKCEDIESKNTFNFYVCSQQCIDLYEEKLKLCNTVVPPELRDKGRVDLQETRRICLEDCQQKVVSVRAEIKAEINRCKDICIYHLKK